MKKCVEEVGYISFKIKQSYLKQIVFMLSKDIFQKCLDKNVVKRSRRVSKVIC